MANLHRKLKGCNGNDACTEHPLPPQPPPLPPPLTTSNQSFSPYLIFMFCGLAVSFSFVCYLLFVARYRSRRRNHEETDETHEDFVYEDLGPAMHHHPIWLINTIGLEQSQIDSIPILKYKKDLGLIEGTDCSVCLSEFEDDESLRLLPKCSHAFHVPCIDTWLRSHKNCPLCRAPIIKNTTAQTMGTTNDVNSTDHQPISTTEETSGGDSETVDHHVVIEVENNGELEKTCRILDERAHSDLIDHRRVHGDGLVPIRRSVSMDESSASIVHIAVANVRVPDQERPLKSQLVMSKKLNRSMKSRHKLKRSRSSFSICSKIVKSSSVGHSSQKANDSTEGLLEYFTSTPSSSSAKRANSAPKGVSRENFTTHRA